jgi:hypothetical protein
MGVLPAAEMQPNEENIRVISTRITPSAWRQGQSEAGHICHGLDAAGRAGRPLPQREQWIRQG